MRFRMKKKEVDPRYSPEGLPPVKNWLVYIYRCLAKMFAYVIFGAGSIVVALLIFIMRIFIHPKKRFTKVARVFTSCTFRGFIVFLRIFGISKLTTNDKKEFKKLSSQIVVANHPSALDIVYLIALIPNADCIVKGGLAHSVLAGVIRQIYTVNTLGDEQMVQQARETLSNGSNLIIFPEGTRTPRHGTEPFKRGASRIALETGYDVQPVYIGGTDKYGLGKHDPWFSFNHTQMYVYDMHLLKQIKTADFASEEQAIAARKMTELIHETVAGAARSVDGREI